LFFVNIFCEGKGLIVWFTGLNDDEKIVMAAVRTNMLIARLVTFRMV